MIGCEIISWNRCEVLLDVERVKKSVSIASSTTSGPEMGLGTMTSLIWAMYSGGDEDISS